MTIDWTIVAALATLAAAIATIFGAFATFISAAIIAIQAYYTARSVRDAEAALAIAQQQFTRDIQIFDESQKARMDSEMPRLAFAQSLEPQPLWKRDPSGMLMNISDGEQFEASEAGRLLAAEFKVLVSNDGPRQALCDVRAPLPEAWKDTRVFEQDARRPVMAAPQEIVFRVDLPISEWIARYHADNDAWRHDKTRPYETALTVDYRFPGNFGANEHHEFVLSGSILQPVPESDDLWEVRRSARSFVILREQPFTRVYYLNRITAQQIP